MRLTSVFFRNARQSQDEKKVPLRAMTQLSLKNFVTGKNQKQEERGCLYEISLLLSCLEENDNEDKYCLPQFKTVSNCYEKYIQNTKKHRIHSENVAPVPNNRNQTAAQISFLLRKYPTV